jgi:hypothetical protein
LVTEEYVVDLIEGCIIQLCKVDALNLSTDVGGQWFNLDPIELHCSFLAHQTRRHTQSFKIEMSFAERAPGSDCTKTYISAISWSDSTVAE